MSAVSARSNRGQGYGPPGRYRLAPVGHYRRSYRASQPYRLRKHRRR